MLKYIICHISEKEQILFFDCVKKIKTTVFIESNISYIHGNSCCCFYLVGSKLKDNPRQCVHRQTTSLLNCECNILHDKTIDTILIFFVSPKLSFIHLHLATPWMIFWSRIISPSCGTSSLTRFILYIFFQPVSITYLVSFIEGHKTHP